MTYRNMIAGAALALSCAFGAPVLAQSAAPTPTQTLEADDINADQIDAFALAYIAVTDLRAQYAAELRATENAEDRQAIVDEANAEITGAVEEVEGIDVETYEAIVAVAQNDPELVERINARLGEMQQN